MSDFNPGTAGASTPSPSTGSSDAPAPGSPGAPDSGQTAAGSASAEPSSATAPAKPSALEFSLPGLLADFDHRVGASEAEPSPAGDGQPSAQAQRFRFADQEYESQSHAEQAFRSLQGQFRPMQTRVQTAEQAVQQWVDYASKLEAQLATAAGGQPGQTKPGAEPAASAPAPTPVDPVEAVDMEFFGQLVEDHGLTVAQAWLAPQLAKAIEAKVMAKLTEMVGPIQAHTQEQQTLSRVNALWSQVAAQRTAAGQPLYPELADDKTAQEVAYIWTKLGLTPEMAMSPTGVHLAVLAHRDYMATYGGTPSTTAQPQAAPGQAGAFPSPSPQQASLAAASAVAAGNGAPPAARPIEGNSEAANELAIRRAILAAGDRRGILGFTE